MASKKKPKKSPSPKKPKPEGYVFGRPTSYRPEYCQKLIEHMRQGHGFHTFGVTLEPMVSHQTLYDWLDAHQDFLEAKSVGEKLSEKTWEEILRAGATGQLRRIKKETPKTDAYGNVMYDANGKIIMEREFEPAVFNATATVFALKNKFPARWRDRKEVELGGKGGGPIKFSNLSKEEAREALQKMKDIFSEAASEEESED